MKYQLAGLKVSLLIHAAVFTLIFSISRLYVTPGMSVPIEIGILTSAADASKNDSEEKVTRQLKRPAKKMDVPKPVVQQQEAPPEASIAQKPLLTQEASSNQKTANESIHTGESGSNNSASVLVEPVFNAVYLKNPKPPYPSIARRMKLEGTVILQVLVSSDGKPEIVQLGKSSGSSVLDQTALTTVQGWSFVPARQGNIPISAWVDVPLRFRLID
jgi:periplasmic protein TonB